MEEARDDDAAGAQAAARKIVIDANTAAGVWVPRVRTKQVKMRWLVPAAVVVLVAITIFSVMSLLDGHPRSSFTRGRVTIVDGDRTCALLTGPSRVEVCSDQIANARTPPNSSYGSPAVGDCVGIEVNEEDLHEVRSVSFAGENSADGSC